MYTIVNGYAYCIKGNVGYKISVDAFGNTNLSSDETINITNQPIYTYDEMNRKLNLKKQADELRKELLNENTDLSIFSEFYDNIRKGFKDKKSFEKIVIKTVDKILNPPAPVHTHVFSEGSHEVFKYQPDVCYEDVNKCDECGEDVVIATHGHNFIETTTMGTTIRACSKCGTPEEDLIPQDETVHTHNYSAYREKTINQGDVCWQSWNECSCGEKTNIVNHEHNWAEVDDSMGGTYWECTRCHMDKDVYDANKEN